MTYDEECGCGAKVSAPIVQVGNSVGWDRAVEQVKDWRENHRHEFPPAEPEPEVPPHIFESQGAAVERSWAPESDARPMVTLGFQRNEVR